MGSLVGGLVGGIGGLISGGKAADAEKQRAASLREAGDRAAAMAQFKPMGMTTAFGSSQFTPEGGGSYTLSPQLRGVQQNLFGQLGAYDPTQIGMAAQPLIGGAGSLFQRAEDYLGQSPEQVSAKFMADQQRLLEPSREAAFGRLRTANFGRGTGGLGVQTGTGSAPSNPLAQALFNAQGQQDLEIAARADQAAMERARFGAGLFGTGGELLGQVPRLTTAGYGPLEAQLGLLGTTEKLGQQPFMLSQDLAGRYAQAGANAGRLFLEPQAAAANAYSNYQGYSPIGSALSGLGSTVGGMGGGGQMSSWFSGLFGGGGGASTGGAYGSMGGATGLGGSMGTGLRF